MKKDEAYKILDQAISQIQASRKAHELLIAALNVLAADANELAKHEALTKSK